MRPTVVEPRGLVQLPGEGQGNLSSCCGEGPSKTLSDPSSSSIRPAQKPMLGPPMTSIATVPANMMRSPQDSASPYLDEMLHYSAAGRRSCALLLYGPQQPLGFVKVRVIRPAPLRLESLAAAVTAATAIVNSV